jgi:hypothetical protein
MLRRPSYDVSIKLVGTKQIPPFNPVGAYNDSNDDNGDTPPTQI